jgi:hypothetical protein
MRGRPSADSRRRPYHARFSALTAKPIDVPDFQSAGRFRARLASGLGAVLGGEVFLAIGLVS